MTSELTLSAILDQLKSATTLSAIFGALPKGTHQRQHAAVRKHFGYLVQLVHPDKVEQHLKKQAEEAFRRLQELRAAADRAIDQGSYDEPMIGTGATTGTSSSMDSIILQSSIDTYELPVDPTWTGDFSALYRARTLSSHQAVILKIAATPKDNSLLEREARLLARFTGPKAKASLQAISRFVPHLLDTFLVAGERGQRLRVNVTLDRPNVLSLTDIRRTFPDGLDPRDAAWIWRRVLGQTLAASMAGVVHGAIVPDHVLVEPITHEPVHLGWLHALDRSVGTPRITSIMTRWRDFYPPEVFNKHPVDHRSDLYMAGQTMIYLVGGDVHRKTLPSGFPDRVGRCILRCVHDIPARRPSDGRVVLDDFTRVIRETWGRVYRPLTMPNP